MQEIIQQQNYMGVAYANLRLSRGVLLMYLPTNLICTSIMMQMFSTQCVIRK